MGERSDAAAEQSEANPQNKSPKTRVSKTPPQHKTKRPRGERMGWASGAMRQQSRAKPIPKRAPKTRVAKTPPQHKTKRPRGERMGWASEAMRQQSKAKPIPKQASESQNKSRHKKSPQNKSLPNTTPTQNKAQKKIRERDER